LELEADRAFLPARLQLCSTAREAVMWGRMTVVFVAAAIVHFVVVSICAKMIFATSGGLSTAFLTLYIALSLPVVIYRFFASQPLSIDLLSWWLETPINSLVYAALVAAIWYLPRKPRPASVRLATAAVVLVIFAGIAWLLQKGGV
jgi:hypothetical protein